MQLVSQPNQIYDFFHHNNYHNLKNMKHFCTFFFSGFPFKMSGIVKYVYYYTWLLFTEFPRKSIFLYLFSFTYRNET